VVIGHGADEQVRRAAEFPHVELLGQVPDVGPHLHAARVSVVPLLHGAGVKGKVVQSLLAGTPVVSTPVGVEGLELPEQGVAPVVVVQDAAAMAAAVEWLLRDDAAWTEQRDAGLQWARAHHGPELVAGAVLDAFTHVVAATGSPTAPAADAGRRRRSTRAAVRRQVADALALLPPGSCALVATGGDDVMLSGSPVDAAPFPPSDPGGEPAGAELVEQLDRSRSAGWSHLVLPSIRYRWLHQHPELRAWLRERPVVHDTTECRVFDLDPVPVMVHVDEAVQDPAVARAHLRTVLDGSDHEVVHMPTDQVSPSVSPLLVRQPGVRSRSMVGLGAGHAVAARGARAVAALRSALEGDARPLHEIAAHIDDAHPVHLLDETAPPAAASARARLVALVDDEGAPQEFPDDGPGLAAPLSSIVIATRDRADLLHGCLASIEHQVLARDDVEVVVVDDGSTDRTGEVVAGWARRLPLRRAWLPGCGRSAAKNLGIMVARGRSVLLLDDDDRLLDGALDAYLAARSELDADAAARCAVLGHTGWAPELAVTPLMHHVTEVGCQLFSYPGVPEGELLDWRHFWEGRLLVDRDVLVLEGLHDPRLVYSIDVELARRIDRQRPLHVLHDRAAGGVMARPIDLDALLVRAHAKGVAQRTIVDSTSHDPELVAYCSVVPGEPDQLAAELTHAVQALRAAGVDTATPMPTLDAQAAAALDRAVAVATALGYGGHGLELPERPLADGAFRPAVPTPDAPELSVVVPVWSLTEQLSEMATETLRRVRSVASLRTEIVVIDNGSPVPTDLSDADRVVTLPHNRGVGPAWNLGASIAAAPLLCFLNSDCEVTSGWDRALAHAATDGRRVAYPYTDHGDGQGPRAPDQAGTAGWCFMLHRELFAEIGGFDETFAPAYFEDTDYWHRAWDMGVDLSPVPAAVVHHQRRTTGRHAPELEQVFERNRRRYEAKHGVGRDAPPPFYSREVVEYPPSGRHRLARLRPWASLGDDRPRVFGIGLNKTGTSSLHAAVSHLGFRSVHHGGSDLAEAIRRSRDEGRPMLADVDADLDAFFDIEEVRQGYAQLDREHPGSKFVLSVRDVDEWVASRVRHVQHQRDLRDLGLPHGAFLDIDVPAWLAEREAHHDSVLAHFAGRPDDLLVIDVSAGQGWERLAPFLGWGRLPERPFPWENRSASPEGAATSASERR
jgi:glycosyltransferase involved in cell wall biosynthesis